MKQVHALFLLVMLFPFAQPAAASEPQLPQNKWIVDWGEQRCSLVRRSTGPVGAIMALRASLGTHRPELVFTRDGEGEQLPSLDTTVEVVLEPAGTKIKGFGESLRPSTGERVLFVPYLPTDFFESFAASSELAVQRKGQDLVRLRYSNAKAAIENLQACNDNLLVSWGVDLKLLQSLQRKPEPSTARETWFTNDDYPMDAVRSRQSGSVVIRFVIGTDGRVSQCVPLVSSGADLLDKHSCKLLTQRARYLPALGPSGQPTAITMVETVNWKLGS